MAIQIGVLIPTFNRATYLALAVKSILSQSYRNLKIIVIDNGSTDGTVEFMATISDPRVRYIVNEKNIGMIGSINKGINLLPKAVDWCTILSDDDLLDKDFIKNLLHTATTSDAKSIVHSHRIFINEQGSQIREALLSPREETAFEYMIMRAKFKRETYLTGVLFNRKSFLEIKGYPTFSTGLGSDDAFIFALALKDRLLFERNAYAYIRIHEEAESKVFSDGVIKLQTLKQFGGYCRRIAKESGTFNQNQLKDFDRVLNGYLIALNSMCWIGATHYIINQENKNPDRLTELLSLVQDNPNNFSFRVRLAVTCANLTGILPEAYAVYRSYWRIIIKIAQFLKR